MSEPNNQKHFRPAGWHTVTPRIVAHQPQQLVDFVKQVFGATGDFRTEMPTIISIGDSRIMISEVGIREPTPAVFRNTGHIDKCTQITFIEGASTEFFANVGDGRSQAAIL